MMDSKLLSWLFSPSLLSYVSVRDKLQDATGCVRVLCRVRPPLPHESPTPLFSFSPSGPHDVKQGTLRQASVPCVCVRLFTRVLSHSQAWWCSRRPMRVHVSGVAHVRPLPGIWRRGIHLHLTAYSALKSHRKTCSMVGALCSASCVYISHARPRSIVCRAGAAAGQLSLRSPRMHIHGKRPCALGACLCQPDALCVSTPVSLQYGATGSGKTYTMEGLCVSGDAVCASSGVTQRALDHVLARAPPG